MTRFRRWIGAVVLAVAAAGLAGCGGDDDDPVIESPGTTAGSQPSVSYGSDYSG